MADLDDFIDDLDAQIKAELADSQAELELANEAVAYAQSISPVDTLAFKESIHVYQDADHYGIQSDDEAANVIEYGSEDTPEHAVFARTAEHFGGKTH